jgi:hypothetical protein
MFFKLVTDAPFPDEHAALAALDAIRMICALGSVEPLMAWRDHVALEAWQGGWPMDDMVSESEREGAALWESALVATRRALRLPLAARLDIELVFSDAMPTSEQHGPDRYIWRRNSAWVLHEWARATLTRVHRV